MKRTHLIVDAGVRYWEDAKVNGAQDHDGSLTPLRDGGRWKPTIELKTGRILNWPQGTVAEIHFKVCDDGEYWLGDADGNKAAKWADHYVPDDLLCVGSRGYGDYIIFKVGADGLIVGWQKPVIDRAQWTRIAM